jgi:hypothetical protein
MAIISSFANLVLTVGEGIFFALGGALGVDAIGSALFHGEKLNTHNQADAMQSPTL